MQCSFIKELFLFDMYIGELNQALLMSILKELDETKLCPGDYIYYNDFYGKKKGFGVFLKFIEDDAFPLTRRKILLKNPNTQRVWGINIVKHRIFYKEHVSKSEKKMNDIIKVILKDD